MNRETLLFSNMFVVSHEVRGAYVCPLRFLGPAMTCQNKKCFCGPGGFEKFLARRHFQPQPAKSATDLDLDGRPGDHFEHPGLGTPMRFWRQSKVLHLECHLRWRLLTSFIMPAELVVGPGGQSGGGSRIKGRGAAGAGPGSERSLGTPASVEEWVHQVSMPLSSTALFLQQAEKCRGLIFMNSRTDVTN